MSSATATQTLDAHEVLPASAAGSELQPASRPGRAPERRPARIGYLDGWRGLAILLVLQAHFAPLGNFDSGRLGVDIFFCLSGFLMSDILFVKRTPLSTFYVRRGSRILPVFIVYVVGMFAWFTLAHGTRANREFLPTLLFLRTYLPTSTSIWASELPIQHLWSLNVEEHSYMFLSLIAFAFGTLGFRAWLIVASGLSAIAIGLAYVKLPAIAPPDAGLRTEVAASYLLLSAGYFLVRTRYRFTVPPFLPLLALAGAAACYLDGVIWWLRLIASPILLAFAVNHLDGIYAWVKSILETRLLRWLGICSYSLYLWQQPFYRFSKEAPGYWAIALFLAVAVGVASFVVIENPARKWINSRYARRRAVRQAHA